MSLLGPKKDRFNQDLFPGDICIRLVKEKNKYVSQQEFVVFKERTWGGSGSKGEFGRFITPSGVRTIKYTSVVFVFDPLSERRARTDEITNITKKFYEGVKK